MDHGLFLSVKFAYPFPSFEKVIDLKFGFGDVEGAILGMHGAQASAVGSRFRYFQRLRFPSGTNTGRGRPATYELDQMLQILLAFELLEAGLTPQRVVRTVRTNWPRLRMALLVGWDATRERVEWGQRELMMLEPTGLVDAARSDDLTLDVDNPLEPVPALTAQGWAQTKDGPANLLFIDPARMLRRFADILPLISAFTVEDLDEAFAEMTR